MSWTLRFCREWFPRLGVLSTLRYRDYVMRERQDRLIPGALLKLRLRRRRTVFLREVGSDAATFQEIIGDQVYRQAVEHIGDLKLRTVIDLGANIGLSAVYFCSQAIGCRVFAVEPHPDTYKLLVRNVAQIAGRVRTLNAAVWSSRTGMAANPVELSHFSAFSVHAVPAGDAEIQGFSMPEILAMSKFETVDLLKVDIEGAEVELFRGDLKWLDQVNAIAIEFHGQAREKTSFDALMKQRGFQIFDGRHTVLAIKRPIH